MDDVLRRLDGRPAPLGRRWLDRARRQWKKLPVRFTEAFGPLARSVHRLPDSGDRRRRPSFAEPTNANSAVIRLNQRGREPAVMLEPGEE